MLLLVIVHQKSITKHIIHSRSMISGKLYYIYLYATEAQLYEIHDADLKK